MGLCSSTGTRSCARLVNAYETAAENIEFVGMPSAKFMAPLRLGEPLAIRLDQQANGDTEFTCTTGSRLIARGCLRYRIVRDDSKGDS